MTVALIIVIFLILTAVVIGYRLLTAEDAGERIVWGILAGLAIAGLSVMGVVQIICNIWGPKS
jgi:hypothetical protein